MTFRVALTFDAEHPDRPTEHGVAESMLTTPGRDGDRPNGGRSVTIMADEIGQVPTLIREQLATAGVVTAAVAEAVRQAQPGWVSIVARGTSDHAAIYARYLIETQLGWPVGLTRCLSPPSITPRRIGRTGWSWPSPSRVAALTSSRSSRRPAAAAP